MEIGAGGLDIIAALQDTTVATDASSPRIGPNASNTGLMVEDIAPTWGADWSLDQVYKNANLWKLGSNAVGVDMNVWKNIAIDGHMWSGIPVQANDWHAISTDANLWKQTLTHVRTDGNIWKTINPTPLAQPNMNIYANSAGGAVIDATSDVAEPAVSGGEM